MGERTSKDIMEGTRFSVMRLCWEVSSLDHWVGVTFFFLATNKDSFASTLPSCFLFPVKKTYEEESLSASFPCPSVVLSISNTNTAIIFLLAQTYPEAEMVLYQMPPRKAENMTSHLYLIKPLVVF